MPFRILCLSGGGVRGIYQAIYLEELMSGRTDNLCDHVDLIAGTSTGSIVGLGVALGIAPSTISALFREKGHRIFPTKTRRTAQRWWAWFFKGPRYPIEPLKAELHAAFGDRRIRDCKKPIVVPSTVLDTYRMRVFTNVQYRGEPPHPDNGLLAANVAMASSAGPFYFPAVRVGDRQGAPSDPRTYVDGGVWANTPSTVALGIANQELGVPFDDMRVLSIGNGEVPEGKVAIDYNKLQRMRMISPLIDMMFALQSQVADEVVKRLVGEHNFLRVNTVLKAPIELDDMEEALRILPARAFEDARNGGQQVRNFLCII